METGKINRIIRQVKIPQNVELVCVSESSTSSLKVLRRLTNKY
jgi:hypothetical protein